MACWLSLTTNASGSPSIPGQIQALRGLGALLLKNKGLIKKLYGYINPDFFLPFFFLFSEFWLKKNNIPPPPGPWIDRPGWTPPGSPPSEGDSKDGTLMEPLEPGITNSRSGAQLLRWIGGFFLVGWKFQWVGWRNPKMLGGMKFFQGLRVWGEGGDEFGI